MDPMVFRVQSMSKSLDKSRTNVDGLLQQLIDLRTALENTKHRPEDQQDQEQSVVHHVRSNAGLRLPHSLILCAIRRESPQVSQLRKRNQALRYHLDEYQSALELIMAKYRNQITTLLERSRRSTGKILQQHESPERQKAKAEIIKSTVQLQNMVDTFNEKIAPVNEELLLQQRQRIHELVTENRGLRQMYRISKEFGSLAANQIADDDDDHRQESEEKPPPPEESPKTESETERPDPDENHKNV